MNMRTSRIRFRSPGMAAVLALAGCGGGGDYYYVPPPPAFEIGALVNGRPVAGLDVLPGTSQTMAIPVGSSFELRSTGAVAWTVVVGGSVIPGLGNTISYGGATVQEGFTTNYRFTVDTFAAAPLFAPVRVTFQVVSLLDPGQFAAVEVVLTN